MSKLRHSLHFGQGKLSGTGSSNLPPGVDAGSSPSKPVLNKTVFMSNVCGCLDSCSAYIQALNSLCAAGTVLAHSLIHVFRELPPYRDIAEQFMSAWEDLSKATAGASAAVKTETLMSLQEVVNRLEEDDTQQSAQGSFNDNVTAVSSCLISYVELQAQFSLSCWKSLSELSKTLAMDAMFFTPCVGGDDGSVRNPDLATSIRKHFAHIMRKHEGATGSPVQQKDLYQDCATTGTVWPPMASYPLPSIMAVQQPCAMSSPKESASKKDPLTSDLEEVINLLSCKPTESSKMAAPENAMPNGQVSWFYSKDASSSSSEPSVNHGGIYAALATPSNVGSFYDGKQTWPRMGDTSSNPFGYENWVWGQMDSVNMLESHKMPSCQGGNPPGMWRSGSSGSTQRWSSGQGENGSSSDDCSSNTGQDSDVFSLGLDLTGTDLVTAMRHRRHSSSDGFPEGIHGEYDNVVEKSSEVPWEIKCAKMSTWPMKQSSQRGVDPLVGVALSPPPSMLGMWPVGENEEKEAKKYTLFGQMA